MERHVKERLVGATILVVLIVLIVPELLSGPRRPAGAAQSVQQAGSSEPVRSVTVDLATNQTTATIDDPAASTASSAPRDVATDGDRAREAMSVAPPNAATPQTPASSTLETGPSSPKSTAKAAFLAEAPAAHSGHGGWAAQIGSFAARANAEKLDRELRAQGFAASLSSSGVGQAARYRVRVGPLADRASAERLVAKLKRAGHQASVVPSG